MFPAASALSFIGSPSEKKREKREITKRAMSTSEGGLRPKARKNQTASDSASLGRTKRGGRKGFSFCREKRRGETAPLEIYP